MSESIQLVSMFAAALMLCIGGGIVLFQNFTIAKTLIPLRGMDVRLERMETTLTKLASDISNELAQPAELWQTPDGRYTATSFDGLLTQMADDPDGPLTDEEISAIKAVFDKIMGETDDDDDDDDLTNEGGWRP